MCTRITPTFRQAGITDNFLLFCALCLAKSFNREVFMITVGTARLSAADFERVLYQDDQVELSDSGRKKVEINFDFLQRYAQSKVIYGINTGLGPMAQYKINEEDQRQLQYNLIRSH